MKSTTHRTANAVFMAFVISLAGFSLAGSGFVQTAEAQTECTGTSPDPTSIFQNSSSDECAEFIDSLPVPPIPAPTEGCSPTSGQLNLTNEPGCEVDLGSQLSGLTEGCDPASGQLNLTNDPGCEVDASTLQNPVAGCAPGELNLTGEADSCEPIADALSGLVCGTANNDTLNDTAVCGELNPQDIINSTLDTLNTTVIGPVNDTISELVSPACTTDNLTGAPPDSVEDCASEALINDLLELVCAIDVVRLVLEVTTLADVLCADAEGLDNEVIATLNTTTDPIDNQEGGILVAPAVIDLAEGNSATYEVSLTEQPLFPVTVTATVGTGGPGNITIATATGSPGQTATLTFDTVSYATPQTIIVHGIADGVASDTPGTAELEDQTILIDHTSASTIGTGDPFDNAYNIADGPDVTVNVLDMDIPRFLLECGTPGDLQTPIDLQENSTSIQAECRLSLGTVPNPAVPIVAVIDKTKLVGNDTVDDARATVSKNFLLFTPVDYNPKTFTVTGDQDTVFNVDETLNISVVGDSQDAGYDGREAWDYIEVLDDELPDLVVVETTIPGSDPGQGHNTSEAGGEAITYEVHFAVTPHPGQSVLVNLTIDPADGAVNRTSVNVTAGGSEEVTVIPFDDQIDQGDNRTGTVTHSVLDADVASHITNIQDYTFNITDDDTAGFDIQSVSGSATEDGGFANYSIALTSQPTEDISVSLATSSQGSISTATTLSFNDTNWQTLQYFHVLANDDKVIEDVGVDPDYSGEPEVNVTATVTTAGAGGGYLAFSDFELVPVVDNDFPGIIIDSGESVAENGTATEGGSNATFTIKSATDLTGKLVVMNLTTTASGLDNFTFSVSEVILNETNWETGVTVEAEAINDTAPEPAYSNPITLSINVTDTATAYDSLPDVGGNVTVIDDDGAGVRIHLPSDINMTEGEVNGVTFTFNFTHHPGGTVTNVSFEHEHGRLSFDPQFVLVSSDDWETEQSIDISSIDNDVDQGDWVFEYVTVNASVANVVTDPTATVPDPFYVNVTDDDTAAIQLWADSDLSATEGGDNGTINVNLATEPVGDVVVNFTGTDDITFNVTHLTFTSDNWNTNQSVNITAVDDNLVEGDNETSAFSVILNDTTADGIYALLAAVPGSIEVHDNDGPGINSNITDALGTKPLEIEEGESGTFSFTLNAQPFEAVTVGWSIAENASQIEAVDMDESTPGNQSSIVVQPADWNVPQNVTVHTFDDLLAGLDDVADIFLNISITDTEPADAGFLDLFDLVHIEIDDNDVGIILTAADPPSPTPVDIGARGNFPGNVGQFATATMLESDNPIATYNISLTDSLDDVDYYVVVEVKVQSDAQSKQAVETAIEAQQGGDPADLSCGGLLVSLDGIDYACTQYAVFEPGNGVEGAGTGFKQQTVYVQVPNDWHIDFLDVIPAIDPDNFGPDDPTTPPTDVTGDPLVPAGTVDPAQPDIPGPNPAYPDGVLEWINGPELPTVEDLETMFNDRTIQVTHTTFSSDGEFASTDSKRAILNVTRQDDENPVNIAAVLQGVATQQIAELLLLAEEQQQMLEDDIAETEEMVNEEINSTMELINTTLGGVDSDGDSFPDEVEAAAGSDPNNGTRTPIDQDGDGNPDTPEAGIRTIYDALVTVTTGQPVNVILWPDDDCYYLVHPVGAERLPDETGC